MKRVLIILNKVFYELLARLGFWIPCKKYLPNPHYWDWVMVAHIGPDTDYRIVPKIARYSKVTEDWRDYGNDFYINFTNENSMITHWHKIPDGKLFTR